MGKCQKLEVILGTKVVQFWSYQKMSITKNVLLNWYSSMKKKIEKDSDNFWYRKLTLKVKRLGDFALFDTFPLTQFSKFKNFLWVCWFLDIFFPDFVPSPWKIHKPYCYNVKPNLQVTYLFIKGKKVFNYYFASIYVI